MYGKPHCLRDERSAGRDVAWTQERGSVTLWLVIFAITSVVLLAFVVDGGQYMNARERAADIAEQAARAGIDQIPASSIRAGNYQLPPALACGAANALIASYARGALSANDRAGTSMGPCQVYDTGRRPVVSVKVQVRVTPAIPVIFGQYSTSATETATIECGTAVAVGVC